MAQLRLDEAGGRVTWAGALTAGGFMQGPNGDFAESTVDATGLTFDFYLQAAWTGAGKVLKDKIRVMADAARAQ